jgi:hypothetical protein
MAGASVVFLEDRVVDERCSHRFFNPRIGIGPRELNRSLEIRIWELRIPISFAAMVGSFADPKDTLNLTFFAVSQSDEWTHFGDSKSYAYAKAFPRQSILFPKQMLAFHRAGMPIALSSWVFNY